MYTIKASNNCLEYEYDDFVATKMFLRLFREASSFRPIYVDDYIHVYKEINPCLF